MPTLRDANGILRDDWYRVDKLADAADGMKIILPFEEGFSPPEGLPKYMLGLHLDNDADPALVRRHFGRLGLISIGFPSFADGRGFSIGRRIRDLGFRGRLRAQGPVISDQFDYLLACGFDEIETPDRLDARQPQPQWLAARGMITRSYQPGYWGPRSVMELRHAEGESCGGPP